MCGRSRAGDDENLSWPANAGHPGDIFSVASNKIVIARFMRATHFSCCQIGSPGRFAPGDDDIWWEFAEPSWVARIRGP
jgi:hypothetical protein